MLPSCNWGGAGMSNRGRGRGWSCPGSPCQAGLLCAPQRPAAMSSPVQQCRPCSLDATSQHPASELFLLEPAHEDLSDVDVDVDVPLRALPCPMRQKRRLLQASREKAPSGWVPWGPSRHRTLQRCREGLQRLVGLCQLWKAALDQIEGKFGTGVRSYFSFLRFLLCLNLLPLLLTAGSVLVPLGWRRGQAALPGCQAAGLLCLNASHGDRPSAIRHHLHDLFSGKGFLECSYLFYGYYQVGEEDRAWYIIRLAYLLNSLGYLLLCFLWILHRSVKGLVRQQVLSRAYQPCRGTHIFSEWDFCIHSLGTAAIKHQSFCNELKMELAEERRHLENQRRTRWQRGLTYLVRLLVNLGVLLLMAVAFYCIHRVTAFSQASDASVLTQYLPSITISLLNLLLPWVFHMLVQAECYSPHMEVNLTLIRCVTLRLGSLGMVLFSLRHTLCLENSNSNDTCQACRPQCWENVVGQEMYKLTVFSFLITLGDTFLISLPRRRIAEQVQHAWLQKEEFLVPQNILGTVAAQTVVWLGIFYCPLLPLLNGTFIFLTFYLKKYTVLQNCRPAKRLFRASSSTFFFQFVLLLGLAMAAGSLTYGITRIRPSKTCGLFANYSAAWKVVPKAVETRLPRAAQQVLNYLTSDAFSCPFIILLSLILTMCVSQARVNKQAIKELKRQLMQRVKEKWGLVGELAKLLEEPMASGSHLAGDRAESPSSPSPKPPGSWLRQEPRRPSSTAPSKDGSTSPLETPCPSP
ncbi:transmembrane channel-like protein 8 isoform X1 [Alligator mississippiensis]|uniref:transmembrane channel-like protein 8 isoform X1 n=2 Tax=Alligator mississippiensis TaxID=8496 RepID=UPI0028774DD5|nr:transmembrane channel-like protein 8 isoform X1 [Alligator mississippiensis]